MITTKLKGGLGNQLFQYAIGRHLAEIHKTELRLDVSAFNGGGKRKYALFPFNIKGIFDSSGGINTLGTKKKWTRPAILREFFDKLSKRTQAYVCERNQFQFDPNILHKENGVCLDGYWQSEKYFVGIEKIIRLELSIKTPLSGKNKEMAGLIHSSSSIGIHIRRGDYVADPHTNQYHGICSIEYYHQCIEQLTLNAVKNPHFFIFSDDPEWVYANFKISSHPSLIVGHNSTDNAHEDLRLMSLCKHQIIANSTFSWWGAWLNSNPGKIVIAPKKWFQKQTFPTSDLIPYGWIRI